MNFNRPNDNHTKEYSDNSSNHSNENKGHVYNIIDSERGERTAAIHSRQKRCK